MSEQKPGRHGRVRKTMPEPIYKGRIWGGAAGVLIFSGIIEGFLFTAIIYY